MFITIDPERINTISADGAWEEIELSLDGWCVEKVASETMPILFPTTYGVA